VDPIKKRDMVGANPVPPPPQKVTRSNRYSELSKLPRRLIL
jgi:hypothetical protein